MSKKKVTLEEAKEILGIDKIFYNGNRKFNVVSVGKYKSGITIEIPQEWNINKNRQPENPIKYKNVKELTDGMNIDFDGDAHILLGIYRLSKNGRPVFELTDPTKAKDTLVRVDWGGAFNRTRGQSSEYAKEIGATFYTRKRSNGGGLGVDYWILPVNFVNDMEPRDVSAILEEIEKEEKARIAEIDEYIAQEDLKIKESIENRERVLGQIMPIIEEIKILIPDFRYEAGPESFIYSPKKFFSNGISKYDDSLINELNSLLKKEKDEKAAREQYLPMYKEMENTFSELGISILYFDNYIKLNCQMPNTFYSCYQYSQEGYNSCINDVTRYQEKITREQEEARIKADELKKAVELKLKKEQARDKGYPEEFKFWNRLGGKTNLSHAYVVESDGTIREPDYNNLRNINHKHNSNWKNHADGTQGYYQILPGEMIITYTKSCTKKPYIFNVEWADGEITEAQLEVICDELASKADFAEDKAGKEITELEQWVRNSVREKSIECKKGLVVEEQDAAEISFANDIAKLAEERVEAKDINNQARELESAYQKQLEVSNEQQSLGDN